MYLAKAVFMYSVDSGIFRKHRRNAAQKFATAFLCTVLLSGCGGSTVKQTFDLIPTYKTMTLAKAPKRRTQILVANPTALKALDGQDIVIRGADGAVAYLRGAQWSDRLTNIVQARLVQALEDTKHFSGVGIPGDGLTINYQLITELRLFGIDLNTQAKLANVEIAVKLMDDKTGIILKSRVFSARVPVKGRSNADYAVALSDAFSTVLQDIVRWVE